MDDKRSPSELINKVCSIFGLQEQAREITEWVSEIWGCKTCLLFINFDETSFGILAGTPERTLKQDPDLSIARYNPVINHLRREKKLFARNNLSVLRDFKDFEEKLGCTGIEILLPLISRQRLMGVLVLGEKCSGSYSQEDYELLESISGLVSVNMEKEYLREKLIKHQDQLSLVYADIIEKVRIDDLTGLYNRRSFDETIRGEVSRYSRYGGVFSLIVSDIDGMKAVNDKHGHLFGDEALRQIGRLFRNAIRSSDQAFRYGGDEFAILLPNTTAEAAVNVAERVRKHIDSYVNIGADRFTISLGLATWPNNGKDVNEIIAAADAALYQAKRNGGNQCQSAQNQASLPD